jgi:hypothetical protein
MYALSAAQYEEVMALVGPETAERLRKEASAENSALLRYCEEIRARLLADPWSVACSKLGGDEPAWVWDGETITWNLDLFVVPIEVEPDPELNTHANDIHQLYARAVIETVDQETADRIAAAVAGKFRDMANLCHSRREFLGPMHPNTLRWGVAAASAE